MAAVIKRLSVTIFICAFMQLAACVDRDSPKEAAIGSTSAKLNLICQALVNIFVDNGEFPANENEMQYLLTDLNNGYLKKDVLLDGWGRPFRYSRSNKNSAIVWSIGENGEKASDDISCSLVISGDKSVVMETLINVFSHPESSSSRRISDYTKKWNEDTRKGG
jgi:hypothetical protein